MLIESVSAHGTMQVYRRKRGKETWIPAYVVLRSADGRILEEFRTKRDAQKWAAKNAKG